MDRINILFLVHKFDIGGVQKVNVQLIKMIDKSKFNVFVIYIKDGILKNNIPLDQVNIHKIGDRLKLFSVVNLVYTIRVIRYIRKNKINIVCSMDQIMYIIGSVASHFTKIKHIRFQPNFIRTYEKLNTRTLRYTPFEKWTNCFITFNKATAVDLVNAGVKKDKVKTIYSFFDPFSVDIISENKIKNQFNINDNNKIVCAIGRLVEGKGFETFLKIIPYVVEKYKNVSFIVVGDGPLRHILEDMSKSLKISKNIHFLGYRTDIPEIVAQIDLGIYATSDSAGMIEVCQGGKVLISKYGKIMSEYIIDGITGYLVDTENPADFADKVVFLLENENILRNMEKEASKLYSDKFDGIKNMKQFESIVTDLVKKN